MNINSLKSIALSYPSGDRPSLAALAKEYEERREEEVLDIASVVADVSTDSIMNLGLEPEANPALREAFGLQYPTVDPASLVGRSEEALEGYASGIKGKLFEVLVKDRLNDGERLGELFLLPGQTASLAESPTQAGWDVQITDSDGSTAELIQLKATTSFSYIKEAFDKYPGIRIAVPSEVDGIAENILQTNISDADLTRITAEQLREMTEGPLTDAMDTSLEWAFDAVPIVPALVVVATEGTAVLLGRSTIRDALSRGAGRLKKSSVFTALGATLTFLDAGVISAPTVASAQIMWARINNRHRMAQFVRIRTEALSSLN